MKNLSDMCKSLHKLLIVLLGLFCSISSFSQIHTPKERVGYYEYTHANGTLSSTSDWAFETRRYGRIKDSTYRFFPLDYLSVGGYANHYDGVLHFTFNRDLGSVKILKSDSLRYYFDNNIFNRPNRVVEKGNGRWVLVNSNLYLLSKKDTLEYSIIKQHNREQVVDMYDAENGIWAITSSDIYLIDRKGGVRYVVDKGLGGGSYCCNSNRELVAITKGGLLRYSSKGVEFTDKRGSSVYQSCANSIKRNTRHFVYNSFTITSNEDSSAIYLVSDSYDYKVKFNFSKIIGVDTVGNIWYTSYSTENRSYYLNYIEKGWDDKLLKHEQPIFVSASNFTSELGADCDLDYSNMVLSDDNSIYIITYYNGIVKYSNGKYKTLSGIDASTFTSIFQLFDLKRNDYLFNLPINLWTSKVWSKSLTGKTGIGYNFYSTNTDSNGNVWRVEKGDLTNDTQGVSHNIKSALDSAKLKSVEEYTMKSYWLLNRIFINVNDVIHIFGKHSIITYGIKSKKWRLYPTDKNGEISYQRIYQDKLGNIWFQVDGVGIFYLDKYGIGRINLPFKEYEYWHIDDDSNLMFIQDGLFYWYKVDDLKSGRMKLVKKISLKSSIYLFNRIKTIIPKDRHIIIVNTEGYYIFD